MPDNNPILAEILQKLGSIEAKQDRVRIDLDDYRKETSNHRGHVSEQLDELSGRVARTENSISISADIDVQVRNELNAIKPVVEDYKRLRSMAVPLGTFIGAIGTAIGASWSWWWDAMMKFFKSLGGG